MITNLQEENRSLRASQLVAFIETVSNPRLQDRLERAICGRGAFRHFKYVLIDYPQEREHWFRFRDERIGQRVLEWRALFGWSSTYKGEL